MKSIGAIQWEQLAPEERDVIRRQLGRGDDPRSVNLPRPKGSVVVPKRPIVRLEPIFADAWARFGNGYAPETEYPFALEDLGRRWRLDFAWVEVRVGLECEGVTRGKNVGGHQRCDGMAKDCAKYNAALLMGWKVLRYTGRDLRKRPEEVAGEVIRLLEAAK